MWRKQHGFHPSNGFLILKLQHVSCQPESVHRVGGLLGFWVQKALVSSDLSMMSHNNRLRNLVRVSFPEGVAIFNSLDKCRRSLGDLGFIEKVRE